jgi:S1-C subfamily serine protease
MPATSRQELVQKADRGVVYLVAEDALGETVASGSGFVIDSGGLVATNYHVLASAVGGYAQFRDGSKSRIKGYRAVSQTYDLAIIELEPPKQPLEFFPLQPPQELLQGTS